MVPHLQNADTMLCDGGGILAEELVYLLQMGADSVVVVDICEEVLLGREPLENSGGALHD